MKIFSWALLLCIAGPSPSLALTSNDGVCGERNGLTCMGSVFGNCCSKDGYCGATAEYCGSGCQLEFGICTDTKGTPSQDGTCGGSLGYTCEGSKFGNCCSQYGFCGSSSAYCDDGCQSGYGSCKSKKADRLRKRQSYDTAGVNSSSTQAAYSTPTTLSTVASAASSIYTYPATSAVNTTTPINSSQGPTAPVNSSPSHSGSAPACSAKSSTTDVEESCVRCEGQPGTDQWCGYDINTDYYKVAPKTCRTVEYTLVITNTTIAPDGIPRLGLLVNGTMPGPLIEANWGDTVKVTVINQMQDNGTTIHFHGIRQNYTNQYDGVPSLTQCPIPPGEQMTYTWVAESYGSSWYHSHHAIQTWDGIYGPVLIHGPNSAEYDVDAGHVMLQDWSHATVESQYDLAQDAVAGHNGGARVLDNGLINGLNTWGPDGSYNQTGKRFKLDVVQGKSYLLRVVNVAIQSTFKFYIDGHKFTVISTDFTPIVPYETDVLNVNIGQRYNVIVHTDQAIGDYWIRSDNQNACAGIKQALDIKGVFHYEGAPGATPTSTRPDYASECIDEDPNRHTPIVALDATSADVTYDGQVTVAPNAQNLYRWYISGTTFTSQWGDPTVLGVLNNGVAPNYSGNLLIEAPNEGEWVYVIVQSAIGQPHPIHLHGHDFYVVAQGTGAYSGDVPLKLQNPSRRDTVLMPGNGYVVIAWKADNPGAWLLHCHVGWHNAMGFAAQILEIKDKISSTFDDCGSGLNDMCKKWNSWATARGLGVHDSGV